MDAHRIASTEDLPAAPVRADDAKARFPWTKPTIATLEVAGITGNGEADADAETIFTYPSLS